MVSFFKASLLGLLFIGMGPTAWGQVTLISFDGNTFSRGEGKLFLDQNATTNTIYGGLGGSECTGSGTSTCNSCALADVSRGCNTQRIYDGLNFQLTFSSTSTGRIFVTNNTDDSQTDLVIDDGLSGNDYIAGTQITIRIPWSEICRVIFQSTSSPRCSSSGITNLGVQGIRIGVDANDDNDLTGSEFATDIQIGIFDIESGSTPRCSSGDSPSSACNFIAYPGDQKVFIDNIRANCTFPSVGSTVTSTAQFIRIFYQEADLGFPDITTGNFADLAISESGQGCTEGAEIVGVAENEVGGLTNDTPYTFAMGIVDEANNVGFVTALTDNSTSSSSCWDPDEFQQNCHIATPAEVIGLIEDEFDCFITTATYGSPFRPKVKSFRQFRNRFLKTNALGRRIIEFYYRHSPPVAQWIRENPKSKRYFRWALWPLWAFAESCLQAPLLVLLSFLGVVLFALRPRRGVRT